MGISVPLAALAFAAAGDLRIQLLPKFSTGEILRYQINTRMTTSGVTTTPIENPEGSSLLKQSADMIIRLDILDAQPAAPGAGIGRIRLRATYEKSDATSETDAYDPAAAALADQYARLQGRSVEFTMEPDGKLSDIGGLDDILSNPSTAPSVRSWMTGLVSSAGFPAGGIAIGQKWSNERPLTGTPLDGLVWHTEASYLRNESCRAAAPTPGQSDLRASASQQSAAVAPLAPASDNESCAVILTRFEILHHGSKDDSTPEDYRRNSLRTSGTWTGSGQSLDAISLASGMLISSTQSSAQDIDFAVTSVRSGTRLTYKGRVESQTEIRLLPQVSSPPQVPTQSQRQP